MILNIFSAYLKHFYALFWCLVSINVMLSCIWIISPNQVILAWIEFEKKTSLWWKDIWTPPHIKCKTLTNKQKEEKKFGQSWMGWMAIKQVTFLLLIKFIFNLADTQFVKFKTKLFFWSNKIWECFLNMIEILIYSFCFLT